MVSSLEFYKGQEVHEGPNGAKFIMRENDRKVYLSSLRRASPNGKSPKKLSSKRMSPNGKSPKKMSSKKKSPNGKSPKKMSSKKKSPK